MHRVMSLFQYSIWYRTPDRTKPEEDKLITGPETVQAYDQEHVKRIALRALDSEWDAKIADIEVDIRPF